MTRINYFLFRLGKPTPRYLSNNTNNSPSFFLFSVPLILTLRVCTFSPNFTNSSKAKSKEIFYGTFFFKKANQQTSRIDQKDKKKEKK